MQPFGEVDFVRDVQPVLEHNCVSCHREDNDKGGVRLDNKKVAFAGDDVIIPETPKIVHFIGQRLFLLTMNYSCPQLKMKRRTTRLQTGKENPFSMD